MIRILVFILELAIVICVSLFLIGVAIDFTSNDMILGLVGLIAAAVSSWYIWSFRRRNQTRHPYSQTNKSVIVESSEKTIPWWETDDRPYKFIFTHDEEVLDAIENTVKSHPKVTDAFQDSGYWYSNGETGPEWFSMHVRCKQEDSTEVQTFIDSELSKRGYLAVGKFMGSYN